MQVRDVLIKGKAYIATERGNGVDEGYLIDGPDDLKTDPNEPICEVSSDNDPNAWRLATDTLGYFTSDGPIVCVWVGCDGLLILAEIAPHV